MISKRSIVQCSALRHASRTIQVFSHTTKTKLRAPTDSFPLRPKDVTRESPFELSAKIVSRPSLFFSGANGLSRRRYASTSSEKPKPTEAPSKLSSIAKHLSPTSAAGTYMAYGATKKLFEGCAAQADYTVPQAFKSEEEVPKTAAGEELGVGEGWWYKDIGLLPTFASWSQVTFLHMYLLTVRFRAFQKHETAHEYSRNLVDHFSHTAEVRMDILHGLTQRQIRVKYLKDLFLQWRGVLIAYDEGLVKGDAVLGAAVWRNLFKGSATGPDGKEVDWTQVARIVAYMRRVLNELAAVDDASLVAAVSGEKSIFALNPVDEKLAKRPSKGLTEPFLETAPATEKR